MHRLNEWGIATSYSELDWVAKNPEKFSDEDLEYVERLVEVLENTEDVESVYTNAL
jgi:transcriptional/translational regulatory protein YebC/TACO1